MGMRRVVPLARWSVMGNSGTLVRMPVFTARSDASVERTANDAATERPVVPTAAGPASLVAAPIEAAPIEIGGPSGPEPTRFGDWEKGGRCIDF